MRSWSWLPLSAALLAQAAPPGQVDIEYELRRDGSAIAEVHERLVHGNGSYELTETWRGTGLYRLLGKAKRTSRGAVAADGLRPLEFTDERTGRDTARAWFDWQGGTVTMQYKGERRALPLPPHAQDRLSFLLALSFVPALERPIVFNIADGKGGLSHHEYRVVGHEKVHTPAGDFDAVKLLREKENERAEIWLATQLGRLPVRILVTERDGTRYDQVAKRISAP
ncbi:MAG: DUF3108 domain-containing protein [Betaproteobacteria bacterium]